MHATACGCASCMACAYIILYVVAVSCARVTLMAHNAVHLVGKAARSVSENVPTNCTKLISEPSNGGTYVPLSSDHTVVNVSAFLGNVCTYTIPRIVYHLSLVMPCSELNQ